MNMEQARAQAHWDMLRRLVRGDGDSAEKHREFYDEYLAVMDLTAEYFLQTVDTVFVDHRLPKGEMMHRGEPVDLLSIRRCAILVVEGEKDDISGVGQTSAALDLTPNLASSKKVYHLQRGVGHYGVFHGTRFQPEIVPRMPTSSQLTIGALPVDLERLRSAPPTDTPGCLHSCPHQQANTRELGKVSNPSVYGCAGARPASRTGRSVFRRELESLAGSPLRAGQPTGRSPTLGQVAAAAPRIGNSSAPV